VDINQLKPIIENIVRKTVTEILDTKLNQILTAQQTLSINENLVLKVGDSVFKGKITGVNKSK
jgi:molybdopterin-binding protein